MSFLEIKSNQTVLRKQEKTNCSNNNKTSSRYLQENALVLVKEKSLNQ